MVEIWELLFMAKNRNDHLKVAPSFKSSRYKRRWEGKNTVMHYYEQEPQCILVWVIFLSFPEDKWPGYLHSSEGVLMGEQWSLLTQGMPLAVFPQVQVEPGEAAATGVLMLMVIQEPLTNKPAKMLHTTQQTIVQIIKEESQPREQFRIPKKVNYLATLSQSFTCGSHGDPTAFWKAMLWLKGYLQNRQGEAKYTYFNT